MSKWSLRRAVRHNKKKNRIGHEASCKRCGLEDIWALRQVGKRTLCAECHLREQGKSIYEFHHVAGKANDDFTIGIPANDHEWLSDAQYDWPVQTLRNEKDDPLLKISSVMHGSQDFSTHVNRRAPEWAQDLDELSAFLIYRIGQQWASDFQEWRDQNDE